MCLHCGLVLSENFVLFRYKGTKLFIGRHEVFMVLQEARLPHVVRLCKQLVMNDTFRDVLGAHDTFILHDFC
jgi:hypothetical protein